jgi:hypothetical protein
VKLKLLRVVLVAAVVGGLSFAIAGPAPAGTVNQFLSITKVVGANPPADALFEITVTCTGTGPFTGQNVNQVLGFEVGGTQTVNMPSSGYEGDCTITETLTSGATPSYACVEDQQGAATCGGGGASPSTVTVNDPSDGSIATVTVTNEFEAEAPGPIVAEPTTTG